MTRESEKGEETAGCSRIGRRLAHLVPVSILYLIPNLSVSSLLLTLTTFS